jgi:hypothetical protein
VPVDAAAIEQRIDLVGDDLECDRAGVGVGDTGMLRATFEEALLQ